MSYNPPPDYYNDATCMICKRQTLGKPEPHVCDPKDVEEQKIFYDKYVLGLYQLGFLQHSILSSILKYEKVTGKEVSKIKVYHSTEVNGKKQKGVATIKVEIKN